MKNIYTECILTVIALFLAFLAIEVAQLHDSIKYDYRPEVRCFNTYDCPVYYGGKVVIEDNEE